ncbi:sister chromatid cohesion protein PDS5 homolog A-like isoform X3 [Magnolia sinica]|uniref:sister chromatid cohesion protein PDS5 homolog A-like isoform X3 n=1 Tax=Magnolia sinica TaxID=86752 RepID=UPI002657D8B9|nr:sister chromatid cohesion protein PDS5 homolog A-like isoform X3 [Magnolia sinica]XP_058112534.1 sister chromatid cohesion protein PDS5 homolog A-like isoform X3 [Magnolia sinica]
MQSLEMDEELQDWSEVKLSKEKSKVEPTKSDFLLSLSPTTKSSSRRKKKGIVRHLNDMGDSETLSHEPEESSLLVENDEKNSIGNFKSPMGANKKRKRRSIARLAMCSTKRSEKQDSELVGCRVKVWWPIDKQFYEGVVQSYNPGKKKHVILYNDGDVEVLQLDKEQWEVISEGSEPSKRLKSSNVSPSKGIFRRKTTIKKNVKNSHSGMSESNIGANASNYAEGRATPELSESHPDTSPEVNEVNSDDFANEQASPSAAAKEEQREAPADLEESDRRENGFFRQRS